MGNGFRVEVVGAKANFSIAGARAAVNVHLAHKLHSFPRAFALLSPGHSADLVTLQRLLGHSDLSVLRRYLQQTEADLKRAHAKAGPVDNLI